MESAQLFHLKLAYLNHDCYTESKPNATFTARNALPLRSFGINLQPTWYFSRAKIGVRWNNLIQPPRVVLLTGLRRW